MMSLKEASRFADSVTFTDTYGSTSFLGQVLLFNDSVRSGPAAKRRILDVAPEVTIPTKRTITDATTGTVYLVSVPSYDYWEGQPIRAKYPIVPADGTAEFGTIGEIIANLGVSDSVSDGSDYVVDGLDEIVDGGVTGAYVDVTYLRRIVLEDTSTFESDYDVYFSRYYKIPRGTVIKHDDRYLRARQDYRKDEVGFNVVECAEVYSPIGTATFQGKGTVYDNDAGQYTPATAITGVVTFTESAFLDYIHEALGYKPIEPGDKAISFLKTAVATVSSGDSIGIYKILAVADMGTYWTCHGRKA